MSKKKKKKTRNAVRMLNSLVGDDPQERAEIEQEVLNSELSLIIYTARKQAKMTQAELAELIGTTQSAISRVEDADYEGDRSVKIVLRVLTALDARTKLSLNPGGKKLISL